MSSLYFLTGENGFLLREERRRWKDEFIRKHGEENLLTLDGPRTTIRSLLDEVGSAPFGAAKRLVILEGTPKFTKEDIELLLKSQHPDCLLLVVDPSPDKRTAGAKGLLAASIVKECPPVTGRTLLDWISAYVQSLGSTIAADAKAELLEIVGEDQDALARELEKIATYRPGASIGVEDVRLLSVPAGEREIWALTSLLARGQGREAVSFLRFTSVRGGDPFSQWNMLLWLLRSCVAVFAAQQSGERSPAKVAQLSGAPFPTVRTVGEPLARADKRALSALLLWAADADIALKTGGYRASGEAPEELQSLLDLLVLKFSAVFSGKSVTA